MSLSLDMDGSFYSDLQSLEEFFTASQKPTISVAVVSTASGDHPPPGTGIYQDEESVDLSALLEAYNDAPPGSVQQRGYPEATASCGSTSSDTFSFREFCAPAAMYGTDDCLGVTGSAADLGTTTTRVHIDPIPTPARAALAPMDSLAGTRPAPGKASKPSKGASKKKALDKNSDEYRHKRDRNNVAVRKSRQKTKVRVVETEQRVKELEDENAQLQSKIALLSKELNVLKSLFSSAGVTQPPPATWRIKEELR